MLASRRLNLRVKPLENWTIRVDNKRYQRQAARIASDRAIKALINVLSSIVENSEFSQDKVYRQLVVSPGLPAVIFRFRRIGDKTLELLAIQKRERGC